MTLGALAYRSTAAGSVTSADLEALLFDARAFNAHSGVTGVLLVAEGQYLQYLEGPAHALESVYARIQASRRHRELEILFKGDVSERLFETWHMAFAQVPESTFLRLAEADWEADLGASGPRLAKSSALQALLAAWHECGGPPPHST
jgi:hypothetical protein